MKNSLEVKIITHKTETESPLMTVQNNAISTMSMQK